MELLSESSSKCELFIDQAYCLYLLIFIVVFFFPVCFIYYFLVTTTLFGAIAIYQTVGSLIARRVNAPNQTRG